MAMQYDMPQEKKDELNNLLTNQIGRPLAGLGLGLATGVIAGNVLSTVYDQQYLVPISALIGGAAGLTYGMASQPKYANLSRIDALLKEFV